MILEEMFNGKFYPCETVVADSPRFKQAVKASAALMDTLWVLSQPLRNLPGKVRNPDVRRTSETLRFRCSGPIWQRVWISAGGRGRSGDTGTDGRLALPGNRGFPAKKRKLSFEAGLHDSEWSNVCSMETVERTTMESNASSAIRVLFQDRDERGRIGARTIRFRIHYAPKTKNLTYH